jgi:sugar/nucleoside kinase (ribokinase family)
MLKYVVNNKFDAIIISDYCKGFLLEEDIQYICDNCDNVFIDTKKQLGDWIKNANFVKINHLEHQKNFYIIPNYPELEDKLIVTQGKNGCIYKGKVYPTKEVPVKDVSGAGDTFLAGLVFDYVKSNDIESAITFAQECTTKVVQKHGVSTI